MFHLHILQIINPLDKFTAVSILSASLFPKFEFKTILSIKTEISCLIFLSKLGKLFQYHIRMTHQF